MGKNIFTQTKTLKIVQYIIIFLLVFHATIFVARFISNDSADAQKASAESTLSAQDIIDSINKERAKYALKPYTYNSDLIAQDNIATYNPQLANEAHDFSAGAIQTASVNIECVDNDDSIKSFENIYSPQNIILGDFDQIDIAFSPGPNGCQNAQIITAKAN